MNSTAYSRPSKLPGGAGDRRPPTRLRGFASKIEPKKLGAGLLAGCCLALLTYVSLAKLFAIYSPVFASTANTSGLLQNAPPASSSSSVPETTDAIPAEDTTFIGRENGNAVDPVDFPEEGPASAGSQEPGVPEVLSRKEDEAEKAAEAATTSVPKPSAEGGAGGEGAALAKMSCDENGVDEGFPYARPSVCELSGVPAVVFSVAGYTDNFFHDNTDALIPLFLTASHLKGEVQLLITNYKPWWVQKYTPVLRKLSNYDPINFDADAGVHCFAAGFLGLYRDRDLIISPHPTRNPRNYTMVDYNRFIRSAYALRRDRPSALGEAPGMRPQMLIISRGGTRKLLNLEEVAAAATELGFNVTVAEAGADVPAFAALVNSADVLLAVHGAGLTNQIFLPTQAVVVQIVPWGNMDWMATNFYGQPAREMQLRYVEYYVDEEETSLKDKYPREHLVFSDPKALHKQGWQALAETIMKQDVKVNLTRFRPFLLQAIDKLQE
ncbi:unnamed protein product [Triticum turgidum subsp. durum]|uniref:Glycosyltransferase 61 catalytic domain-containing protein n=1 Tax=Triticum turgidum subsp. durum TaxID=4567 RepID=A0A9R1PYX3_TRITD|nr:unnamed protein product [Triticum turgidum subsp. durum]